MRRNIYQPAFIAAAASFVPVVLNLGLSAYTIPAICIIYSFAHAVFRGQWLLSLWVLGHVAIYLGVFYALGRLTFWLSTLAASLGARISIQSAVLLALFACSCIRVITYDSLTGSGGTYTFWGAVARFGRNKLQ